MLECKFAFHTGTLKQGQIHSSSLFAYWDKGRKVGGKFVLMAVVSWIQDSALPLSARDNSKYKGSHA